MSNYQEKPIILEEVKSIGIFVGSTVSKSSGHQTVRVLSNGKIIKSRNLYPSPEVSRITPGASVVVIAKYVEWIMSDFESVNIGSREFGIVPAATGTSEVKKAA